MPDPSCTFVVVIRVLVIMPLVVCRGLIASRSALPLTRGVRMPVHRRQQTQTTQNAKACKNHPPLGHPKAPESKGILRVSSQYQIVDQSTASVPMKNAAQEPHFRDVWFVDGYQAVAAAV